jgi:hypothetical protein
MDNYDAYFRRDVYVTGTVSAASVEVVPGDSFPTHAAGLLYYHSTSNKLYCSNGSAWNALW